MTRLASVVCSASAAAMAPAPPPLSLARALGRRRGWRVPGRLPGRRRQHDQHLFQPREIDSRADRDLVIGPRPAIDGPTNGPVAIQLIGCEAVRVAGNSALDIGPPEGNHTGAGIESVGTFDRLQIVGNTIRRSQTQTN